MCACEKLRTVARHALGEQESGAPSHVTVCAKHLTTARPWWRGQQERGGEARRKKKGTKGPASPPGWRARVLGCTLARERRARADARVNANAPAQDREREQHGAGLDGEKD
jgi:hypothetical protein